MCDADNSVSDHSSVSGGVALQCDTGMGEGRSVDSGQQKPDNGEDGGNSRPVWVARQRPILAGLASERLPADSHPLLVASVQKQEKIESTSIKSTAKKSSKTKLSVSSNPLSDPLSDPLSNPLSDPLTPVEEKPLKAAKREVKDAFLEEWRRVRRECLAHSSSTTLPLVTILPGENSPRHGSTQEWMADLEARHNDLVTAWSSGERVEALQVVVQCVKSLSDISAVEFYPAKFLHVIEVVEHFSQLVTTRLEGLEGDLRAETAANWYYKVTSVRELLPRLLLEASLQNLISYWPAWGQDGAMERMSSMVRGIGDPLVAAFTMAYLLRLQSKVGLTTNGVRSGHHHLALLVGALREEEPRTYEKITFSDYLALYKPAIGWTVLLLVRREDESGLVRMFKETQISSNCELVLEAFLQHLPGHVITSHASTIVSTTLATPLPTLVAALGMALVRAGDALPGALDILTKSWAIVTEMSTASDHLPSAAAWLQFAATHFPTRDLNKLVVATVKRVREGVEWDGKDGALEGLLLGLLAKIR